MQINQSNLKFKGEPSGINNPERIIIHHALSPECTIDDIHRWHLDRGWVGCGYHFVVRRDGSVYAGRPVRWPGAHTKEDNMNRKSIGVCLEGCYTDYKGLGQKIVPKVQLDALIDLCYYIEKEYDVSTTAVDFHRDYTSGKDCPGKYFPKNEFYADLGHWAEKYYQELLSLGVTVSDRRFREPTTRAESMSLAVDIIKAMKGGN